MMHDYLNRQEEEEMRKQQLRSGALSSEREDNLEEDLRNLSRSAPGTHRSSSTNSQGAKQVRHTRGGSLKSPSAAQL